MSNGFLKLMTDESLLLVTDGGDLLLSGLKGIWSKVRLVIPTLTRTFRVRVSEE